MLRGKPGVVYRVHERPDAEDMRGSPRGSPPWVCR